MDKTGTLVSVPNKYRKYAKCLVNINLKFTVLTMEKVTFSRTITPNNDIMSFIERLHDNLFTVTLETLDYHL